VGAGRAERKDLVGQELLTDVSALFVRVIVHLGCVRLSEWAKQEGIHYQTAWKWFKDGTSPVPARQTATGTILIDARRPFASAGVGL
jgi:hypothetical protein